MADMNRRHITNSSASASSPDRSRVYIEKSSAAASMKNRTTVTPSVIPCRIFINQM